MSNRQHEDPSTEYDAVVVGAGFGGLRMLQELRKLGVSARLLEAGSDVGGTWYWNRYPGARTDCESWVYAMNFSQALLQEWDWSQRYAPQDEVQRYLKRHVAERFDLLSDIQFDTWVDAATYDEDRNRWTVCAGGQSFTCTYLIWATGLLSAHYVPQIEGLDTFQGEMYFTAHRDNVSLVDVSGSPIATITRSGVQTASAHYDCDVLIIATGFDAGTGALMRIEVTGRDGQTLAEKWQDGPKTYLGLAVDEFPNMFLISGPQSSFSNIPLVVDYASRWIVRAITRSPRDGETPLEPTPEAVEAWGEKVNDVMRRPTVIAQGAHARSWQVGANVPGKAQVALFHLAGYAAYAADCERATADDFAEFTRAVRRGPYNEVGDHDGGGWHH